MRGIEQKINQKHRLRRYRFGGLATALPRLKFQLKMAYSWGKWQGCHLSGA